MSADFEDDLKRPTNRHHDAQVFESQSQTQSQAYSQGLTQNDAHGLPFIDSPKPLGWKPTLNITVNEGARTDRMALKFKHGGIKVKSGGIAMDGPDSQDNSQQMEEATQADYGATQEFTPNSQRNQPQVSPPKPLTVIAEERESMISVSTSEKKSLHSNRKSTTSLYYSGRGASINDTVFKPPSRIPEAFPDTQIALESDSYNIVIPATQEVALSQKVENTPQSKPFQSSPVRENETQDLGDTTHDKSYLQSSPLAIPNTPNFQSQVSLSPAPTPGSISIFGKPPFDSLAFPSNYSTPAPKRVQNFHMQETQQTPGEEEPLKYPLETQPEGTNGDQQGRGSETSQTNHEFLDTTASYYKYTEDSQTIFRQKSARQSSEKTQRGEISSESSNSRHSTSASSSYKQSPLIHSLSREDHTQPVTHNQEESPRHAFPETQPLLPAETQPVNYTPERNFINDSLETQPLGDSKSPSQTDSPPRNFQTQQVDEAEHEAYGDTQALDDEQALDRDKSIPSNHQNYNPEVRQKRETNGSGSKSPDPKSIATLPTDMATTDTTESQNPIVGHSRVKRKFIHCEDSEVDVSNTNSHQSRQALKRVKATQASSMPSISPQAHLNHVQEDDENNLAHGAPATSPSVSPISQYSQSPQNSQPENSKNGRNEKTPETDKDASDLNSPQSDIRSSPPLATQTLSQRDGGDTDNDKDTAVKSLWIRDRDRFYPAIVAGDQSSSQHHPDRMTAIFGDGSLTEIRHNDMIPLNLEINNQVKCRKNGKVVYAITELFDSTTKHGKSRLEHFKLLESKKPTPTHSKKSNSRQKKSRGLRNEEAGSSTSSVHMIDNAGNDYVVLTEQTTAKRPSKSNQPSETIHALISELYLTRKQGLQYTKSQNIFSSLINSENPSFRFTQSKAESTTTEEMPMSSLYNPKRKSARISEGTYYESPDEDSGHFSISEDFQRSSVTSTNRSLPSTPVLEKLRKIYPGIFSGCIFTITHTEKKEEGTKVEERKFVENLEKAIQSEGGIVLVNGFKEILDVNEKDFQLSWMRRRKTSLRKVSTDLSISSARAPRESERSKSLPGRTTNRQSGAPTLIDTESDSDFESVINPGYKFAAVLANEATRTIKYMEGIALGFPCLSWQFVKDCIEDKEFIPNWCDYVLSAGGSSVLGGVPKSLNVAPFHKFWVQNSSLQTQFASRQLLLATMKAPIYLIEDVGLALQAHLKQDGFSVTTNVSQRPRANISITKSTSSGSNKVFRSLLLMLGCESKNICVATKLSDIKIDREEGAIIIFNCAEQTLEQYSSTPERSLLASLRHGESLHGSALLYNREWILQSIINQRLV